MFVSESENSEEEFKERESTRSRSRSRHLLLERRRRKRLSLSSSKQRRAASSLCESAGNREEEEEEEEEETTETETKRKCRVVEEEELVVDPRPHPSEAKDQQEQVASSSRRPRKRLSKERERDEARDILENESDLPNFSLFDGFEGFQDTLGDDSRREDKSMEEEGEEVKRKDDDDAEILLGFEEGGGGAGSKCNFKERDRGEMDHMLNQPVLIEEDNRLEASGLSDSSEKEGGCPSPIILSESDEDSLLVQPFEEGAEGADKKNQLQRFDVKAGKGSARSFGKCSSEDVSFQYETKAARGREHGGSRHAFAKQMQGGGSMDRLNSAYHAVEPRTLSPGKRVMSVPPPPATTTAIATAAATAAAGAGVNPKRGGGDDMAWLERLPHFKPISVLTRSYDTTSEPVYVQYNQQFSLKPGDASNNAVTPTQKRRKTGRAAAQQGSSGGTFMTASQYLTSSKAYKTSGKTKKGAKTTTRKRKFRRKAK